MGPRVAGKRLRRLLGVEMIALLALLGAVAVVAVLIAPGAKPSAPEPFPFAGYTWGGRVYSVAASWRA